MQNLLSKGLELKKQQKMIDLEEGEEEGLVEGDKLKIKLEFRKPQTFFSIF